MSILQDKFAVISGGTSGIGARTAELFVSRWRYIGRMARRDGARGPPAFSGEISRRDRVAV